jgi:hypothetical protein
LTYGGQHGAACGATQPHMAHPEGQRERPDEAPATGETHVQRSITVPIPTRDRGEDEEIIDVRHCRSPGEHHLRPRSRACPLVPGMRPSHSAGGRVRLPAVLRPAGGRLRLPTGHPRLHRGRTALHLALSGPAACPLGRAGAPEHRARPHPPDQGRPARRRPGCPLAVGKGRHRQPDTLVQGPRRRRRPGRRARAGLLGAVLPLDRQPRQRRGRRGRARRMGLGRARPLLPRAGEGPHHRGLRRHPARRRRQLRRRQPARHRTGGRARGLGVRERQRPALLRRGLQDPRLRGRRAARLAAARTDRRADRLRLPADEGGQGLH